MKFIYLTCNISKLEQVLELLKAQGSKSYQVIENVNGVQPSGNPRMNDAVWPGSNSVVFIQAANDETDRLFQCLKGINRDIVNESERILAVSWDCEKVLYFDENGGAE
ncbi:MAG TPA: hypothetical protein P5044_08950 [bacterium]|nr:hypothetical protein [bacterium]